MMYNKKVAGINVCIATILGLSLILTSCVGTRKVILPSTYNQRTNDGAVVASIPQDESLYMALHHLQCGEDNVCEIQDYGRVFYIKVGNKEVVLQDSDKRSDVPRLAKCGEKYICTIATDTITILKIK